MIHEINLIKFCEKKNLSYLFKLILFCGKCWLMIAFKKYIKNFNQFYIVGLVKYYLDEGRDKKRKMIIPVVIFE